MSEGIEHFFWFVMFFWAFREFIEPWEISFDKIKGTKTRLSVIILALIEKYIMLSVMYFAAAQLTPWF